MRYAIAFALLAAPLATDYSPIALAHVEAEGCVFHPSSPRNLRTAELRIVNVHT